MVSCSLLVVNQFQKVSGFVFMLLGGWLYDDCFFLEGDAEFVLDVGGDGVGKGEDFVAGAAAEVGQDEGLFWIDAAVTHGAAFPTGTIDEPASRELILVAGGIGYYVGVLG